MITAVFQFYLDGKPDGRPFEKTFKNEQDKVIWMRDNKDCVSVTLRQVGVSAPCPHCLGTGKVIA
jgi:hypothetical protein